ncbi:MAG: hypothetical protein CL878_03050 [Dehalococcoidia bacterium]|nr:hypothetical protein [Dehalococcoidia bacterium]
MPSASSSSRYLLDPSKHDLLADALGDTPETVITIHHLRRRWCHAYVAGSPTRFDGAIVQERFRPGEPAAFGSDPEVLWELLQDVRGWDCVLVSAACAQALGEIITAKTGMPVRYYGDITYTLSQPPLVFHSEAVRQLTLGDVDVLESAPPDLQGRSFFGSPQALLTEGIAAGAFVANQFVSIARTAARSERHTDLGVYTAEAWRGRGFSTAASAIVARRVQETGRTPVWSTGEDNHPSQRVAQKLGFTEVSRATYVIPDKRL